MQGDFSRWTFDAREDYRSVLLQQGRVLLDADWNEQTELTRYHDEIRALDIVGRAGGPTDDAGFGIIDAAGKAPSSVAWAALQITPGRYYVDGILCEARLPDGATGPGIALSDQPYLAAIGTDSGLPEPEANGRYALYLDVWTYHVTADEEPALRESALGGPDTTTRARTVWQVRVVGITDDQQCSDLYDPAWLTVHRGTMTPSLRATPPHADPCLISTSGGYTRLENQLYRVQIHDIQGGTPRYLWSRENGSVVAGLLGIDTTSTPGTLNMDRVGRDDELSIHEGDTVEVTSTDWQLRGQPGFLATAGAPDGLVLPVTGLSATAPDQALLGRAPIVRRWEGPPRSADATLGDLEDGIQVSFSEGSLRTGDYWLIPARTVRLPYGLTALSGTLDWPRDANGNPVSATPLGPVHHVTPLAILTRDANGWTQVSDCRRFTPSLNQLIAIDLIGGDGQEATPDGSLPAPIRVAVRNGGLPVAGARVRFTPSVGKVILGAVTLPEITTATGADGVASVNWTLDPTEKPNQVLIAQRLDDRGNGVDVPIIVTGRLNVRTPGIHVNAVKIKKLDQNGKLSHDDVDLLNDSDVTALQLSGGITVELDGAVLKSSVEARLKDGKAVRVKTVVRVVIDLPWQTTREVPVWQDMHFVGFRSIQLDAQCTVDGGRIGWMPAPNTINWLVKPPTNGAPPPSLFEGLKAANWDLDRALVARLVIDGWAIIGQDSPQFHLNGHANTKSDGGLTRLELKTDDEVTGGQFVLWFNLIP